MKNLDKEAVEWLVEMDVLQPNLEPTRTMKQTAVEWQFEQMFNSFEKFNNGECTFNDYLKRNLEIRKQAKEMEKEQKETYKYTEEDLRKAISFGQGMDLWKEEEKIEKFIQSLNQTKQQEQ